AVVLRCPVSMSQLHALRFLTQSRKLRAWRSVASLPEAFFGLIRALLPLRYCPSFDRVRGERAGNSLGVSNSGTISYAVFCLKKETLVPRSSISPGWAVDRA